MLLEGLSLLHDEDVFLVFVGDGPALAELEHMTERLGLGDKVIFVGMVPPERMHAYYRAADVFLSASTSETQGLTYVEAMASSLPLVCRRDASLDLLLEDGVNGYLFDTVDELAGCIEKMVHVADRKTMGEESLRKAAPFSVRKFTSSVEGLYDAEISGTRIARSADGLACPGIYR